MPITQKQIFDLNQLKTVTVVKGFTFTPPTSIEEAKILIGGDDPEGRIISMLTPLLENEAEQKALDNDGGWHTLSNDGTVGGLFEGKVANESRVAQMTTAIAKQVFDLDGQLTPDAKQHAKDQAWQLILSTPKLLEALRKSAAL